MWAGTAWAQVSAGRAVDTNEERDPRQDGTRALIPPSSSGGHFPVGRAVRRRRERDFLYVHALGRGGPHRAASGPFTFA